MNLYAYCANNPINWIDPWGLGRFGKRPLKHSIFKNWRLGKPRRGSYGDRHNNEFSHEQYWYDDGTSVGYDPEEDIWDDQKYKDDYTVWDDTEYNDEYMREAERNLRNSGKWRKEDFDKNNRNCQDFCSRLRKEYRRIKAREEREKRLVELLQQEFPNVECPKAEK